jgi:superfamily II DNA or RNA helicase
MQEYDINVKAINTSYLQITCDNSGIYYELHEKFSFFADGYKFQEKFKRKIWDGKVRLFNRQNRTLPFGLYPELLKFAKDNEYTISPNVIMPTIDITEDDIMDFGMNTLKLPFEPRDFQVSATTEALRTGRKIILAPTGGGKSLILYMMTMYIQDILKFENILIIVPTVGLVTQLHSDFCEYSINNKDFDPDNILLVPNNKGIKYDKNKNVTITTWQSMMSVLKGEDAKEFFSKYEAVLVDEVHTMAANIAKEITLMCSNTPIKIGMTGTLSNTKTGELAIKGLFGPVYKTTTTAELIESGTLTDVRIKAIQVDHKGFNELKTKLDYVTENQYIRTCEPRTNFISKLATRISNSGNTLVLYQNLDQGKALYETISSLAEGKHVFLVNGSTKAEVRESVRKFAETNNDVIIIAGFQIFATGINIKNLHNLIFASPSKSMIRILQSVGRILRTHHSKDVATVYDIYDSFDYRQKSAKSFGVAHFVERFRIYSEAQLQVDVLQGPTIEVSV